MNLHIFLIMLISYYILYIIYQNNTKEYMPLKSNCDVRDENCSIACSKKNKSIEQDCFKICQINSPIC